MAPGVADGGSVGPKLDQLKLGLIEGEMVRVGIPSAVLRLDRPSGFIKLQPVWVLPENTRNGLRILLFQSVHQDCEDIRIAVFFSGGARAVVIVEPTGVVLWALVESLALLLEFPRVEVGSEGV